MCTFNFFVVFICVYLKILLKEKLNFTLLLSWISKLSPSMTNFQEPPLVERLEHLDTQIQDRNFLFQFYDKHPVSQNYISSHI